MTRAELADLMLADGWDRRVIWRGEVWMVSRLSGELGRETDVQLVDVEITVQPRALIAECRLPADFR